MENTTMDEIYEQLIKRQGEIEREMFLAESETMRIVLENPEEAVNVKSSWQIFTEHELKTQSPNYRGRA